MKAKTSTFYLIAAISGVAAPALFTLLSVITALLWPGFDPVRRTISQLALAPNGGIQTAAFYIFSILGMLFIVGLRFNIQRHRLLRPAIVLLFLCAFGFLLTGWREHELGLYERTLAGSPLVWLEVMAIWLLRLLIHEKRPKVISISNKMR